MKKSISIYVEMYHMLLYKIHFQFSQGPMS